MISSQTQLYSIFQMQRTNISYLSQGGANNKFANQIKVIATGSPHPNPRLEDIEIIISNQIGLKA